MSAIRVASWTEQATPSEVSIGAKFKAEGLSPSRWSNGERDRYGIHHHSQHKVLYCVRGSITFNIGGQDVTLHPGDRLDIPPETHHSAVVGEEGVTCMEAFR